MLQKTKFGRTHSKQHSAGQKKMQNTTVLKEQTILANS
jgi:hypothetical protein